MTNVQIRDFPDELLEALRGEARANERSLQQHLTELLRAHAIIARRNALLDEIANQQSSTSSTPSATMEEIRASRDEREQELANRADR